jgi:hypothetical protein
LLPANSTLSSLITADPTELDPLSYLRAIAVFLWSLLQQGDTCSNQVPFYTPRCPLWQPPTPAPVPQAEAKLEIVANLTASTIGHALYVVFHRLNTTVDAKWQAAGLKIPISLGEQTRFACAGWYCKFDP